MNIIRYLHGKDFLRFNCHLYWPTEIVTICTKYDSWRLNHSAKAIHIMPYVRYTSKTSCSVDGRSIAILFPPPWFFNLWNLACKFSQNDKIILSYHHSKNINSYELNGYHNSLQKKWYNSSLGTSYWKWVWFKCGHKISVLAATVLCELGNTNMGNLLQGSHHWH